jgi:cysteinyl-tRNA synthetase
MVTVDGQKMGKSLGNYVTLKDAFSKFDPLVLRFFILQGHYRSTLDFSDDALHGAKVGLEKLLNTIRNLREEITRASVEQRSSNAAIDLDLYKSRFLSAMDDDFNSPQGIAVLFDLSRETNALLSLDSKFSADSLRRIEELFQALAGSVLGIVPQQSGPVLAADAKLEGDLVHLLINLRADVRAQKLWALSDKIRDGLKKLGITLEDKKDGTGWRKS